MQIATRVRQQIRQTRAGSAGAFCALKVAPTVLSALSDLTLANDAPEADRRLTLANWIASAKSLTARVAVNRIWQFHFGAGLVLTSSDFGRNGAKPSHPELLD